VRRPEDETEPLSIGGALIGRKPETRPTKAGFACGPIKGPGGWGRIEGWMRRLARGMEMHMRLDKYLADGGIGSRDQIKKMIKNGRVVLALQNGSPLKPETQVEYGTELLVDGKPYSLDEFEYYVINKPAGCLTARTDPRKPVVMDLIPSGRKDLSPVGRLDEDTEGLLLITNDGALNHRLVSPKYHVKKTYYTEVDREIPDNGKARLEAPMDLGDFVTAPAEFEQITSRSGNLTITEGKFHQVKRMFEQLGCTVTYLRRDRFGSLTLGDLAPGEWKKIALSDIEAEIPPLLQ